MATRHGRRLQRLSAHMASPSASGAASGGTGTAAAIELANGQNIPQVGYGAALFGLKPGFDFSAFPSSDDPASAAGDDTIEALVGDVIDAGYRHIDTAHCCACGSRLLPSPPARVQPALSATSRA
jgi:hypothetical protein